MGFQVSVLKKRRCTLCRMLMLARSVQPAGERAWVVFYCELCDLIRF